MNTVTHTITSVGNVMSGEQTRVQKGMEDLLKIGAVAVIGAISGLALHLAIDLEVDLNDSTQEVGLHHVDSHEVSAYTRDDGTEVKGYHRGGDTGYLRTNPDDTVDNNLS